jgi:hypothetical protein
MSTREATCTSSTRFHGYRRCNSISSSRDTTSSSRDTTHLPRLCQIRFILIASREYFLVCVHNSSSSFTFIFLPLFGECRMALADGKRIITWRRLITHVDVYHPGYHCSNLRVPTFSTLVAHSCKTVNLLAGHTFMYARTSVAHSCIRNIQLGAASSDLKICIARTHHYHPCTPAEEHDQRTYVFISEGSQSTCFLFAISGTSWYFSAI